MTDDWFPPSTLKVARRDGRHVSLRLTQEALDDWGDNPPLLVGGYPVGEWSEQERGWWVLCGKDAFGSGKNFHISTGCHLLDDDIAGWRNLPPLDGRPQ